MDILIFIDGSLVLSFKYRVENNLADSQKNLQSIKQTVGRRKLRNISRYILKTERENLSAVATKGQHDLSQPDSSSSSDSSSPSSDLTPTQPLTQSPFDTRSMELTKEAIRLHRRIKILQARSSALKSRQCSLSANKSCCPEAFLEVVSEKLTYTAVMFIYVELLNEFFFQLPREVDNKLYYDLSKSQILKFARQNPEVARHLAIQERKTTLELVMEKLRSLSSRR